jgi:hypothetical protein
MKRHRPHTERKKFKEIQGEQGELISLLLFFKIRKLGGKCSAFHVR